MEHGVPSITGADELRGLELGDTIGHVSSCSEGIVFDAFVTWVHRSQKKEADASPVLTEGAPSQHVHQDLVVEPALPATQDLEDASPVVESTEKTAETPPKHEHFFQLAFCQWRRVKQNI